MKIGIIGDCHFGAGYNLGKIDPTTQHNSRLLDFSKTFDSIIDKFVDNDVKVVVLTGDVFETRHPTSSQLNAFSVCVQRALDKNLEVVIVAGNHDQQRIISTTTVDIFNHLRLDKTSVYTEMAVHKIKDGDKDVNIILMPYRDRRMLNAESNTQAIEQLKNNLNNLIQDLTGTKIVVGHFMLEKTLEQENPDSFSINELILPLEMFGNVNAVVMGHVHRHSVVLSDSPVVIYSGSMERVSFGEKDHTKVTVLLDSNDIDNFTILETDVRDLIEIELDYSEQEKPYKGEINSKIIEDIDEFSKTTKLQNTIMRLAIKLKDIDMYHLNQQKLKEFLMTKQIEYLAAINVSAVSSRQLRNAKINEGSDVKQAMLTFIKDLSESEQVKKKLVKYAEDIIEEVEGK